jgi:hypothetical protein
MNRKVPSFTRLSLRNVSVVREASGLPAISHSRHRETIRTIACKKRGVEVARPIPQNASSIGAYGSIIVIAEFFT